LKVFLSRVRAIPHIVPGEEVTEQQLMAERKTKSSDLNRKPNILANGGRGF